MKEERKALINWSSSENKWVLRLWINGKWEFSKSWSVKHVGEDEITGVSIDLVNDSIISEIAHLQNDLHYNVTVTC